MLSLKRFTSIIAVLLMLTLVFTSCSSSAPKAEEDNKGTDNVSVSFPYTFTDSAGNKVTVEKKPEKVAVLFSSYVDIWTTAGGKVDITVGDSVTRGFADSSAVLVNDTVGSTIDQETLVAAQPDLIIGTTDQEGQVEACKFTSSVGIPSALFTVESFDDYLSMLKICCDLTGDQESYTKNGTQVKERIDYLLKTVNDYTSSKESLNILFIRAGGTAKSTKAKNSTNNFACVMLDELHTKNIADSAASLMDDLSLEAIVSADPDYIFLSPMGDEAASKANINDLFSQDGWKDLSAVKGNSYSFLPKDLFHYKPNSRWAESYEYLIKFLYPELKID